jgi:uncharacterized membrane protein
MSTDTKIALKFFACLLVPFIYSACHRLWLAAVIMVVGIAVLSYMAIGNSYGEMIQAVLCVGLILFWYGCSNYSITHLTKEVRQIEHDYYKHFFGR